MDKREVCEALERAAKYADAGADDTETAALLRTLKERIEGGEDCKYGDEVQILWKRALLIDWSEGEGG